MVASLPESGQAAILPFATIDEKQSSIIGRPGIEEANNDIPFIFNDTSPTSVKSEIFGVWFVNGVDITYMDTVVAENSTSLIFQKEGDGGSNSLRVPIPGAVWLLASALVGLVAVSRVRSDRSAAADQI